jgi:hypothetical protein
MVDKDAAEKSNAAGEALLSELALDDKNIEKGGNDARQRQGKLKDNKKKKVHRKAKEFKVSYICYCLVSFYCNYNCLVYRIYHAY